MDEVLPTSTFRKRTSGCSRSTEKPPRQLTQFTERPHDRRLRLVAQRKRLAISRVSITNDIVLFRGLKK